MDEGDVLDGKRILIADDEPDILDLVVEDLSRCRVDRATTYEEAREKLATQTYDVVILDIMGIRGFELLEEFGAKAPTIVVTARALSRAELDRARAAKKKLAGS